MCVLFCWCFILTTRELEMSVWCLLNLLCIVLLYMAAVMMYGIHVAPSPSAVCSL